MNFSFETVTENDKNDNFAVTVLFHMKVEISILWVENRGKTFNIYL